MAIVEKLFADDVYIDAPTDGTTNASPALARWLEVAATIIAGGDTPKLRMQGHTYNFAGVPNGPSNGLSRAIIDGEGATVGEFWLGNAGVLRESFLHSARIGTVTAGATSATIIQGPYPNDVNTTAAFLSVGQWILITGISMQAGGYPPNFQYNEFRKITSIVGNVVSWDEPLVYEYKQTWPLCDTTPVTVSASSPAVVTMAGHGLSAGQTITFSFDVGGALPTATPTPITRYVAYYVIAAGLTTDTFRFATTSDGTAINTSSAGSSVLLHTQTMDHGGPATIYGLMDIFEGEHQYSNITCAKTQEVFGGGTTSLILDNVNFNGDGPCPSMAKSWIHKNSVIGSQNEVDKCVEYCEYNNCTAVGLGQVMFFSPGCMRTLITGCTFKTLNGAAHNLALVDSDIYGVGYLEGFLAGCTAFGRTNTITLDGTTVNQGQIAGNVLDLATFAGWFFSGGTFSLPLTYNAAKNEALRCFVPGYKYIVGYGSGRNTTPETGSPVIFTVASMYQDATHLYIYTNLASANWPNYGGGFQPDRIFSYAARAVTQTDSGPLDVTTLAEPVRTFIMHLV
jgi:hypothetical protein